jgi:tripartite-type tricarboxylate transporter receptor subunit TctC
MEKILKTPVQVLHRPGAATQVGLTELIRSKPDGYTIGYAGLPNTPISYLDPDRKAVYTRKSFRQIATHFTLPHLVAVRGDGPYKTLKDLADAAKAKPEGFRIASNGLRNAGHLAGMLLEKAAGVTLTFVHFDGDAPAINALLGGHVDVTCLSTGALLSHIKNGGLRALGVMDRQVDPFVPEVKTLVSHGYDVVSRTTNGLQAPAGTPPEVLAILADTIKKAQADPGHQEKMTALGFTLIYVGLEEYTKMWDDVEAQITPLLQEIRR